VAGEASGDLHGARLIQALKKEFPNAQFAGHGGDNMQKEGMNIIEHVSSLSMMGFTEVFRHLPYMLSVMKNTVSAIQKLKPARIILIDYPGFNLRLAKRLFSLKVPITYFILPQVWAWKENRISILKNYVDQLLSIVPFEKEWFSKRKIDVDYVGHPFSELKKENVSKAAFFKKHRLNPDEPLLVLLPGSRQKEIDRHWSVFLKTVELLQKSNPFLQAIVGKAADISIDPLPDYIRIESNTRLVLQFGTAALAASGTVTLEAAVLECPIVVTYKLSGLSWAITKRVVKVPYASMVNLIAGKQLVPEYLQSEMTADNLQTALTPLLKDTSLRNDMISEYSILRNRLGSGDVYANAAMKIRERML